MLAFGWGAAFRIVTFFCGGGLFWALFGAFRRVAGAATQEEVEYYGVALRKLTKIDTLLSEIVDSDDLIFEQGETWHEATLDFLEMTERCDDLTDATVDDALADITESFSEIFDHVTKRADALLAFEKRVDRSKQLDAGERASYRKRNKQLLEVFQQRLAAVRDAIGKRIATKIHVADDTPDD